MTQPTIESPEYEVVEIAGTITFVGDHKVTFTLSAEVDRAEGEQPWIGKSTDIRTAINEALGDNQFWDDGMITCPNCDERVDELQYAGMPYEMCDSCVHNARRSGWDPGDHLETLLPEVVTALRKYETETDPNGYDGTPAEVVDEMAAVLRKIAGQEES